MPIKDPIKKAERNKRVSVKVKEWRERTKKKVILSMGGKCQTCGYHRCHKALELHHIDPTQKEKKFGQLMAKPTAIDTWFDEFRKCVLLCSNCHKELHAELIQMPENYKIFDEKYFMSLKDFSIQELDELLTESH